MVKSLHTVYSHSIDGNLATNCCIFKYTKQIKVSLKLYFELRLGLNDGLNIVETLPQGQGRRFVEIAMYLELH